MSPSAKKRPKNRVDSEMQEEGPQDMVLRPVSKGTEWNRLKTVLKNLSLLRLLKSSNPRIQELYNLAKRWNSLFRVLRVVRISSGNDDIGNKLEHNSKGLQEARCPKSKLKSKKLKSVGEPEVGLGKTNKAEQLPEAVPQKEEQVEPKVPMTLKGHSLTGSSRAQERQPPTRIPGVDFLKTHQQRTPMGNMKQLEAADQWVWFEGLPTRVHLPGPRVMCRSSPLRWVKRCCTRFCSASLELPMFHPYRVVRPWMAARAVRRRGRLRII
ncbi:TP53-target gene 5 protein isoform X2 [Manis javanica]|uniref:TP53-target gene 5 protein isoform X2 n=1 Tax=Manis javanica TaxID=9974 RepID=UPI003C6D0999